MLTRSQRLLLLLAAAIAIVCMLAAFGPSEEHLITPAIHYRTAADRHATLAALRTAWNERPDKISPDNDYAERQFLYRLIGFIRRTKGSESYYEACGLWNVCYHDHATRYDDFIDTP